MGAFNAAWRGDGGPVALWVAGIAVSGVVLGALYMLWFAQRFLFGAERVPHGPVADLNLREKSILAILVAAVFWLGLFPDSAMKRTELAAREYQQLVRRAAPAGDRSPAATPARRPRDERHGRIARHGAGAPAARGHRGPARPRDRLGARARGAAAQRRVRRGRGGARRGLAGLHRLDGRALPRPVRAHAAGGVRQGDGAGARGPRRSSCRGTTSARARSTRCSSPRSTACACSPPRESFLTLFLGIELMSIPVYVLVLLGLPPAGERRGGAQVPGALGHGERLVPHGRLAPLRLHADPSGWGASPTALAPDSYLARTAVVMVVSSFFLKAAIVPFHGWAPDAYEAASVPSTAYMAVLVKAGVLIAAARVFGTAPVAEPLVGLLAILPLASIVWGNLAAMRQPGLRRMIAYSSIAHAGYLFFAFLGDGPGRFQAVVFYLAAYGVMNVLAFAALPSNDERRRARQAREPEGALRHAPVRRAAHRHGDALARGHPALPGLRRQVPDLQERDRRGLHDLGRARASWAATSASTSTCA